MAQRKIILVYRWTYRGVNEESQMNFHFNGAEPQSEAGFKTVMDEVWTAIKPGIAATTSLVRGYGYKNNSAVSDFTVDYVNEYGGAVAGTLAAPSGGVKPPGDVATFLRFGTVKRSLGGKPVYLYTYLHDVYMNSTGGEALHTTQKNALFTAFSKLVDGTLTNFGVRTTPDGQSAVGYPVVATNLTTHTVRHRGRRLPTNP